MDSGGDMLSLLAELGYQPEIMALDVIILLFVL